MHEGVMVAKTDKFHLIDCKDCGYIHVETSEKLETSDFYSSHFYETEKPEYIENNVEDAVWWDFTYGLRIDRADALSARKVTNWLDVGTGPGNFMDAAVKKGKSVKGVEPSTAASQHAIAKGHEVVNAYFNQDVATELGIFEGVHCSEVLEHIPNPVDFLGSIKKVMDEDSILCIVVPNDFSLIQDIYTSSNNNVPKWWIDPPFHLNYFTNVSLRSMLEANGFEVIYETSMFPIDLFLLMGDHYVGNDLLGKAAHSRRKKMELAFFNSGKIDVLNNLYEEMSKLGIGRELVFYSKLVK